ncbi:glutathione S-transferase family protein [Pseudoalteromonas sp. CNC9-20]|uniref:glutathione S-transferase family protein n=1 Tax=Pseudoalteromonas sp. CNC9-20 TaxID=2917750 RepID=UPI001EF406A4|nr:glutathione S-transferase family protein [Pseudoalteromonas sp. CNC9-20]
MNKVHIIGLPFSTYTRSVQLFCELIGVNYTLAMSYADKAIEMHDKHHRKLHPMAKIPILIDGDTHLCETTAILHYLNDSYASGEFLKLDPIGRAHQLERMSLLSHYVNNALIRDYALELALPKGKGGEVRVQWMMENKSAALDAVKIVETWLAENQFLAGSTWSLVDMMALPSLYYVSLLPRELALLTPYSPLHQYLNNVRKHSGAKKVLQPASINASDSQSTKLASQG